jgi:hypothetical protein
LGATLAVVAIVLTTLCRTAIASFGTNAAHLRVERRIARHESSAERAGIGAVAAQFDTLSHHLHHITTQAGIRTNFAIA